MCKQQVHYKFNADLAVTLCDVDVTSALDKDRCLVYIGECDGSCVERQASPRRNLIQIFSAGTILMNFCVKYCRIFIYSLTKKDTK